jgi:hypothetical protein
MFTSVNFNLTCIQWKAYPKLPPTPVFPPVKLDHGFYYVNSFEPYVFSYLSVPPPSSSFPAAPAPFTCFFKFTVTSLSY